MFSFFRSRAFVVLIGFLLIAIFIWFAGPYFGFGDAHPLETEFARLIAIGLVIVCWMAAALVRRLRARRASGQLLNAVVSQPHPEKDRPSAEAAKLRERFEEAVAALQKQQRSLYDLPWYVFIGAPGSGKTTALINSGLKFPLEQRVGKGAVRGVGGTRNCDWWFTEEAVFLDTAGRYTTQDSDATSDSEGWKEFLALLGKYRKRRPVNGIVLTISAQDLMTQGDADREAHVDAARRRLSEFSRELNIQLPVYVMVTKCDMVAGFTEYFDDLAQEGRAQVWGVTFPYEQTMRGDAADGFPVEFDALMARLNARLFTRLDEERTPRRRATVFGFPQQMGALRDLLAQFVSDVFASTPDRQVLLRGVYLTSGTQDGTQIDRLLGAIGRRFGIAPEAVAPPSGRGKAYFVERLLKDVVIGESGLAGVNRRVEMRKAAWQLGAYAAIVLVAVVGLVIWSVSYTGNRDYIAKVDDALATLRGVPPPAPGVPLEALLPHLNAVRGVADTANAYRDDIPWRLRWGLYQGASLGKSASDAYLRELDSLVLPQFASRVKQHLIDYESEPEKLYVYLKAYLMLGYPAHLNKEHLQYLADLEWTPAETAAGGVNASVSTHFRNLLADSETLRPIAMDTKLVATARTVVQQASIPKIMYGQVKRSYSDDSADAVHLDVLAAGIEKVFRMRSGGRLSDPIPGLYTKKVFNDVTGPGMALLLKQFTAEEWVWGSSGVVSLASWPKLKDEFTQLYENDYISIWDRVLNDIEIVPFTTVAQYADALGRLVGPTSPFIGLLKAVVENTSLVAPPSDAAAAAAAAAAATGISGVGSRLTQGAKDLFNTAAKKFTGTNLTPGTAVTLHFQAIHTLMAGAPAPIDAYLAQVRKLRDQLLKLGPQTGGATPLSALTDAASLDLRRALQQDAVNLPDQVQPLVEQIAQEAAGSVSSDATRELERRFQEQIVAPCRVHVEGRYPFGAASDMPLADFGEMFGYGGVYEKFFTEHLLNLVDTLQHPWVWRESSVEPSPGILARFELAERIRKMFFAPGSKTPEFGFTVRLWDLDAKATRFYVNIGGQDRAITPGAENKSAMTWPGEKKLEKAFVTFEDNVAAPEHQGYDDGPWALFRLVDYAAARPAQPRTDGDLLTELSFQTKFHRARITIEASSAMSNPFAGDWRQFKCEP